MVHKDKMANDIDSIEAFLNRSGDKDLATRVLLLASENGGIREREIMDYFKQKYPNFKEEDIYNVIDYCVSQQILMKETETVKIMEEKKSKPKITKDGRILEGKLKERFVTETIYKPSKGWKKNAYSLKEKGYS